MAAIIAILLGVVQGLTEFLPISSSAHLVFTQHLLRLSPDFTLNYDVILHLGTTLALLIFFRRQIREIVANVSSVDAEQRKTSRLLIFYIIIGSIPIAIIGLLFKTAIEKTFAQPIFPAIFLIVTGLLLLTTKLVKSSNRQLTIKIVILIGIAQAIGLLPGISRSGATIGIALLLGINPTEAFEFSFLLSIPAVIGANILVMKDFTNTGISFLLMTIGIVVTAVTGFLALLVLRSLVLQKRFYYFGFYCVLVGILALIIF